MRVAYTFTFRGEIDLPTDTGLDPDDMMDHLLMTAEVQLVEPVVGLVDSGPAVGEIIEAECIDLETDSKWSVIVRGPGSIADLVPKELGGPHG